MSGAAECYGMLSMRMGLQSINQTRGLLKSLAGPTAKSVHLRLWLFLVSKLGLALSPSSGLLLHIDPECLSFF